MALPFAIVGRAMPGQILMDGFSRFIFRIFTVAAAVSAAEKISPRECGQEKKTMEINYTRAGKK
jgi:hypothetical protein